MHPHLTQVFSRLDQARSSLRSSVDAVPPPLRQQRPAPERWSAAEVLEHLSMVERLFAGRVASAIDVACAAGLGAEMAGRTPLPEPIEARMADRLKTRSAPDAVRPTGTVDDGTAWAAIEDGHSTLRALVGSADGLALSQVTIDHPAFGSMSVYQWVELIAAHEARHAAQIREIAAALAAPAQH